jgi:hypothetical protein
MIEGVTGGSNSIDQVSIRDRRPGEAWLAREISDRVNKRNLNLVAAWIGATGSGKSWSALRLAELIDLSFSVDRVVFTKEQFLELVNADLPRGSVIVWDEAGLGMPAREWQSVLNRSISYILQTFRFKNLVTFLTVPSQYFLDSQARALFHLLMDVKGVQIGPDLVLARPFFVSHGKDGTVYEKHPRIDIEGEGATVLEAIKFSKPSDGLIAAYESRRRKYLDGFYESLRDQWATDNASDAGVPIWAYRALLGLANPCPECKHKRTQAEVAGVLQQTREWTNKLINQKAKPALLREIERKEKEAKLEASLGN